MDRSNKVSQMYDFSVLRDLRKRSSMTLQDVSDASMVSVAVISKLERNQTMADIDTLYKLARVFRMSASELLAMAESSLAHRTESQSYASEGCQFKMISYRNAAGFHVLAPMNARIARPEIHGDDYEICWTLSGSIEINFTNERYVLSNGDAIQFDAMHEHAYHALEDSELFIMHIRKGNRF